MIRVSPDGLADNNMTANAGGMGLTPDQGTKIARAAEQPRLCSTTREAPVLWLLCR